MEGISVGLHVEGTYFVSLNYVVRSQYDVEGWHYNTDYLYKLDKDMVLLDNETLLGPKVLIEW